MYKKKIILFVLVFKFLVNKIYGGEFNQLVVIQPLYITCLQG